MKALGIITWIAISTLLSSLLHAWALATLWHWFASAQYGVGPSLGAWFGLAVIGRLALRTTDFKKSTPDKNTWGDLVVYQFDSWLAVLTALGTSWIVGVVVGWIR